MKTKKNILAAFIVFAMLACSSNESVPAGILTEEELTNLIADIEVNQAIYKLKFANKNTVSYNDLVAQTFTKHNVTKAQFNENITYYAKYPKKMSAIYENAIVSLTQKQAKLQGEK